MPIKCQSGINIPPLENDPCDGKQYSTKCIYDENVYAELGIEADSTQEEINMAIYTAFLNMKATLENLQQQIDNLP